MHTLEGDRDFLAMFIDHAVAGRPQGYRRDDLQEALRRLAAAALVQREEQS